MILIGLAYFAAFLERFSAALWRPKHNTNDENEEKGLAESQIPEDERPTEGRVGDFPNVRVTASMTSGEYASPPG